MLRLKTEILHFLGYFLVDKCVFNASLAEVQPLILINFLLLLRFKLVTVGKQLFEDKQRISVGAEESV